MQLAWNLEPALDWGLTHTFLKIYIGLDLCSFASYLCLLHLQGMHLTLLADYRRQPNLTLHEKWLQVWLGHRWL